MKSMKRTMTAALVAGAAAASVPAIAQDAGFYLGGGVGQARWDVDTTGLTGSSDDRDYGWKVFAGYQFNRYFAIEGGYADFGNATFNGALATAVPPFAAGTAVAADLEANAWFLALVGTLPVSNQFSVLAKLGVSRTDLDLTARVGGLTGTANEKSTEATYGLGVRFDATRNLGIRAEWDRFRGGGGNVGDKGDVDLFSINLVLRF